MDGVGNKSFRVLVINCFQSLAVDESQILQNPPIVFDEKMRKNEILVKLLRQRDKCDRFQDNIMFVMRWKWKR